MIKILQFFVSFFEIAKKNQFFFVELPQRFKIVLFSHGVKNLLESSVFDLKRRQVVSLNLDNFKDILAFQLIFTFHKAGHKIMRKIDDRVLVLKIGLFQLMIGVAAPVHSLLINRDIN